MKKWNSPQIEELKIQATRAGDPGEDGDGEVWTLQGRTIPAGPGGPIGS